MTELEHAEEFSNKFQLPQLPTELKERLGQKAHEHEILQRIVIRSGLNLQQLTDSDLDTLQSHVELSDLQNYYDAQLRDFQQDEQTLAMSMPSWISIRNIVDEAQRKHEDTSTIYVTTTPDGEKHYSASPNSKAVPYTYDVKGINNQVRHYQAPNFYSLINHGIHHVVGGFAKRKDRELVLTYLRDEQGKWNSLDNAKMELALNPDTVNKMEIAKSTILHTLSEKVRNQPPPSLGARVKSLIRRR